jgi:hypothetical protein
MASRKIAVATALNGSVSTRDASVDSSDERSGGGG